MKLRLSRKQTLYGSALLLLLLGAGTVALIPGTDPILEEIQQYASDETEQEAALRLDLREIRNGKNPNVADSHGYTPLMRAARVGKVEAVDYLLVKGARLHRKGPDGKTAAAMAENDEIRTLLKACALAERNPDEQEKEQMRRSLREANINPDNLTEALFEAINNWRGNSVILTAQVLALGGNANAVNAEGRHILQQRHRDPGSIILLLRQGSKPNAAVDSQGASHAVLNNISRHPRAVQALLTAKASVKGANALAMVAGRGESKLVRQFLELGADANGVADNGKTVLEHAIQGLGNPSGDAATAGISECVKLLLAAGARTEYQEKGGKLRSPLSPGGMSILPECLRLLVDAGANVNALNSRGANYAHIAVYKAPSPENLELLEDIVDAGADLKKVDDKGETFLFYALPGLCSLPVTDPDEEIRENAIDLLEDYLDIIEDAEPDPAALDRNGNTALHLAVIRRGTADDRLVEFLLEMGVDPAVRNVFGRTALEAMLRNPCGPRSKYVARLLTQKGPMPTDPGLQLVLASMIDDTAAIRKLLATKPSHDIMAVALGCVQNATAADLLLKAGAPGYYENMAYMVRHGNPDVVRIFAEHKRLHDLAPHWDCVRTEAMAKAFVEAGLMPGSPEDIANEKVLAYLLSLPDFSPNGVKINMSSWRQDDAMLPSTVKNGRKKMTRLLLEHGVALNGYDIAPLADASDVEIAEMLIEHGTDLTWRGPTGETLLSYHKNKLKQLARGYSESPTKAELEAFRTHHAIAEMLEDAGVSDIHPRKEEIKKQLQRGAYTDDCRTVTFVTPEWSGPVHISDEAMVLARASGNTDTANIISMGPDRIKLKWDRWGYSYFVRKPDGNYHEMLDEDRYRDLLKAPTKVPHYYIDFTEDDGKEVRLYLHPDLEFAVRGDTLAGGKVQQLQRRYSGGIIKIKWLKGGDSHLINIKNKLTALNAETAREVLKEYRPVINYSEVRVVGKSWQDTLRISPDFKVAVRRSGSRDTARVLVFNNQKLTLKWDRWGEETFAKQGDGKYHKLDARQLEGERIRQLMRSGSHEVRVRKFRFTSRHWSETVLISFKHKVAVRTSGPKDAGTVVKYDKDSITIKWDLWKEDTFVRQPNGTYRSTNNP